MRAGRSRSVCENVGVRPSLPRPRYWTGRLLRRIDADLARHRQAARHVLVHADARAEVELVDELRLELVRPIGRAADRAPASPPSWNIISG